MFKIEDIKSNLDLSRYMIRECLVYFYTCLIGEEKVHRRKFVTGVGVNQHDFPDFIEDYFNLMLEQNEELVLSRWVYNDRIFKYRKQLISIFGKYEYLMNTKGL